MIARRTLSLFVLSLAAFVPLTGKADEPPSRMWQFDVALDDRPIGSHTFEVQPDGERQVLTTEAEFDVKFLFITAFRYRHRNTEIWSDGCLTSIDASTDNNGQLLDVKGEIGADEFAVQTTAGSMALPTCVQTFAYWNPAILESTQLLNSQTGAYEDVSVSYEGPDQVDVAGVRVGARRYRLSAQSGDIMLWYSSDASTWIGLEAPAKGGRTIRYRAVTVPEANPSQRLVARSD